MVILMVIVTFMVISTVLVIAAGMLSSRLSRQEGWVEEYQDERQDSTDTIPETVD